LDFLVQIVVGVLGLPVAKVEPQIVLDRSVGPDRRFLVRLECELVQKLEILLPRPRLERVAKGPQYDVLSDLARKLAKGDRVR